STCPRAPATASSTAASRPSAERMRGAAGQVTMGGGSHRARAGIGLRAPHVDAVVATRPAVGWLEVHAEDSMGAGPALRALGAIRRDYPVSIHGVGLSLGSADGVDARHLERLAGLVDRLQPSLVSEHLSWSVAGGAYLNHLLPVPGTPEALA